MSLPQRFLYRVFLAVTWKPVLTIAVAILFAVFSVAYTVKNLDFQTSQKDLIYPDHKLIQLSELIDPFDSLDDFIVAIENRNTDRSLEFLHALLDVLHADKDHYVNIFYRVYPDSFKPWAVLYLDEENIESIGEKLKKHSDLVRGIAENPHVGSFFRIINQEMTSSMMDLLFTGFLANETEDEEIYDLGFLLSSLESMRDYIANQKYISPWKEGFLKGSWDEKTEGYFWTENKNYLMFFVTPRKIKGSFNSAQQSLDLLRQTIEDVRKDFPDIEVGVTGQEALNMDEMTQAFDDMSFATVISFIGLALLLIVFWRGIKRPIFEMIELSVALCITFALTTLVVGHLNILSIVFAPLLLGLGIDYGIHWLSRYQEEKQKPDVGKAQAVENTMVKMGPGIILAGFTASLSFFPLILTDFKGLVELGMICSMGMIVTTMSTLTVLPALTMLFDKPAREINLDIDHSKPLYSLSGKGSAIVIFVSLILFLGSIFASKGVKFDLNLLNLQSKTAESVIWEKNLLNDSQLSSMYGALIAYSREEVREKAMKLEKLPTVSSVRSIEDLVPVDQDAKREIIDSWKEFLPKAEPIEVIPEKYVDVEDIDKTLSSIRFKMDAESRDDWGSKAPLQDQMDEARQLIGEIRTAIQSTDEEELQLILQNYDRRFVEDIQDTFSILKENVYNQRKMYLADLPDEILKRFVGADGLLLIRVFPDGHIWEPEFLGRFVDELRTVDEDAIGDPVTLYIFTKAFRDSCTKAAVFAVVFIILILVFTFRNPVYAFVAMLPLFIGTVWTLGMMGIFNIDFNLANVLFIPLIVGAGVEYGIIILQRWRHRGESQVALPFSTGRGIILAGLTTTVAFGSLILSDHQGTASLGMLATFGSLCVMLAAVVFLPSLLKTLLSLSKKDTLMARVFRWKKSTEF